jgi:hypothetical protein
LFLLHFPKRDLIGMATGPQPYIHTTVSQPRDEIPPHRRALLVEGYSFWFNFLFYMVITHTTPFIYIHTTSNGTCEYPGMPAPCRSTFLLSTHLWQGTVCRKHRSRLRHGGFHPQWPSEDGIPFAAYAVLTATKIACRRACPE